MLKRVREILERRMKLHPEDDYRIEQCRNELIEALSQDEWLTIEILNIFIVHITTTANKQIQRRL